jgi:hypothetical protein
MVGWLMDMVYLLGWELARETEVFKENLLQWQFIYLWHYSPWGTWPQIRFIFYTQSVGLLGWVISPSLRTHRWTQTQNKCKQTSMPRVGFESMIPVFQREKTVHALDHAAIVIDSVTFWAPYIPHYVTWDQSTLQKVIHRLRKLGTCQGLSQDYLPIN